MKVNRTRLAAICSGNDFVLAFRDTMTQFQIAGVFIVESSCISILKVSARRYLNEKKIEILQAKS